MPVSSRSDSSRSDASLSSSPVAGTVRRTAAVEAAAVAALLEHFDQAALPPWTGAAWNAAMGLPYEAYDPASGRPLPPQRYRAMACARQLFVFSQRPAALAHADTLFASLCRYFRDPRGGWLYSIDANGAPLDTTRDLYTHAFVVFACAAYWQASGNAAARRTLDDTAAWIEAHFALPGGRYHPALREDFSPADSGLQQNPVMHLTEAYLAARAATAEPWYGDKLRKIAYGVGETFLDEETGCILELEREAPGNRIEPGHQFEWYALLAMAPDLFAQCPLADSVPRACAFAERNGVARATRGVVAALDRRGRVIDASERIWAQTEYARALALRQDAEGDIALRQWLRRFPDRFLHAAGWHECLDGDGRVKRADMPSTTPYHLATAYAALRARPTGA